jgi:hypothetical protein
VPKAKPSHLSPQPTLSTTRLSASGASLRITSSGKVFDISVRLLGVRIDEDEFIGLLTLSEFPENRLHARLRHPSEFPDLHDPNSIAVRSPQPGS